MSTVRRPDVHGVGLEEEILAVRVRLHAAAGHLDPLLPHDVQADRKMSEQKYLSFFHDAVVGGLLLKVGVPVADKKC